MLFAGLPAANDRASTDGCEKERVAAMEGAFRKELGLELNAPVGTPAGAGSGG